MFSKFVISIIALSMGFSIVLAAKDPQYNPLAMTVFGGGLTVISELMKNEVRKQLSSSKEDSEE